MKRDQMGPQGLSLLKKAQSGDSQSLARLLSLVETDLLGATKFLSQLKENSKSVRLGITGPPGAGKSTLINLLVGYYRKQNLKIAILAIDPSSPFSGGAILGDRVRMTAHGADQNVFIRSLGSRGGFGGLSVATGAMARCLEAAGFDIVIIETVGVGQTELQVMNLADATAVILVPESGDFIQTLKAGILEIADIFVVNKSDRPGAELLENELKSLVEMEGERSRPVLLTSGLTSKGVEEFAQTLKSLAQEWRGPRRKSQERLRDELKSLFLWVAQSSADKTLSKIKITNVYKALGKLPRPKSK